MTNAFERQLPQGTARRGANQARCARALCRGAGAGVIAERAGARERGERLSFGEGVPHP